MATLNTTPSRRCWFTVARWFVLLLVLLPLLSACGNAPGGPASNTVQPATITFAAWGYEQPVYEALATQFSEEHPDITVQVIPLEDITQTDEPVSEHERLRRIVSGADTAVALGVPPAAFGTNLLLNLEPLMSADSTFNRDDFSPGTLEQYTTEEGIWVLPRSFHTPTIAYHKGLFSDADLPAPENGWSWNDVLAAAEQLAVPQGNGIETYGFLDPTAGLIPFLGVLDSEGLDLLGRPPGEVVLDNAQVIAVAQRLRTLTDQGAFFMPRRAAQASPDEADVSPDELIRQGRVAMWDNDFGQMGTGSEESQPLPFEVGIVAYPAVQSSLMSGGDGYIISSGTQHPQAAWQWIEFLSRRPLEGSGFSEGQSGLSGMVPARESLAQALGYWEGLDEQTAAAYRWSLEHYPDTPTGLHSSPVLGVLGRAMMEVLSSEEGDAAQAMADAQRQLEERIAEQQLTPTPAPETGPVVVATPAPQSAPEGATSITFSALEFSPVDLRQVAQAFNEAHPDIFVEINAANSFAGPMDMATLVESSDCLASSMPIRSEDETALLLDLQPLFDADAAFAASDYPPALLDLQRHNGRLLGLPYTFTIRTLNYHTSAFDEAGLAPPNASWTPDDFLGAAQTLTSGSGDEKHYGYVPSPPTTDLFFFVAQLGGNLTTGSGDSVRPNFDDPVVVDAIQWYIDLWQQHDVMPKPTFPYQQAMAERQTPDPYQMIQQGRVGMWFDYGYGMFSQMPGQRDAPDIGVQIAPLPIGAHGLSTSDIDSNSVLRIAADTPNPQACWEWMKFLSGNMSLRQWGIPARLSVAQSEEFLAQAPPDTAALLNVYTATLAGNAERSVTSGNQQSIANYWLYKAITQTIDEGADLEEGLQEAQEKTNAFQECIEQGEKPATCATQADPQYEGYLQDVP